MRHTAEALGFLVMRWGQLEAQVNRLLMTLLARPADLYYEVCGHIDFREKLQIIKSVMFALSHEEKLFSSVEALLKETLKK